MIQLLQIATVVADSTAAQAAKEALKEAAESGNFDAVVRQLIQLGIQAGKSIVAAIIVYFVGRFLVRLLNRLLNNFLERRNIETSVAGFVKSLTSIVLNVLLIVTVVGTLGVNTASFAALLASLGLAVGMALSGNMQNFAGGLIVLFLKPFRVGDFIEAQGQSGVVTEIQIFHTIILTGDNKRIYLPNGALSGGNIINYANELRRVDITVGVEYGIPADRVKAETLAILNADPAVVKDDAAHAPFVALSALADSSVNYTVRAWVKGTDYWPAFFRLQENIYTTFNQKGIGFPFPQVTVHRAND